MRIGLIGFTLALLPLVAAAAGDPARGARLFRPCTHCHTTIAGQHAVGPSLATIFGRKAATVEGFDHYSKALKSSSLTWDAASLDPWLADPAKFLPGNTMAFPGVLNRQVREHLIAYLQAVSEGRAEGQGLHPPAEARRIDLKKAPAEGQVRSITLCKDTYTVETGDGHKEAIPESYLRFRTDSSELGPDPGKPVAIGGGRSEPGGFVIFASPAEISGFIKTRCE